jgi:hypothetical protein
VRDEPDSAAEKGHTVEVINGKNSASPIFIGHEGKSLGFSGLLITNQIYVLNFTISNDYKKQPG